MQYIAFHMLWNRLLYTTKEWPLKNIGFHFCLFALYFIYCRHSGWQYSTFFETCSEWKQVSYSLSAIVFTDWKQSVCVFCIICLKEIQKPSNYHERWHLGNCKCVGQIKRFTGCTICLCYASFIFLVLWFGLFN